MNIPRELAAKMMEESPAFRQYVLDTFFGPTESEFKTTIRNMCLAYGPNGLDSKVGAIKALREYSKDYLDCFSRFYGTTTIAVTMIGLADAKRIVELYI